MQVWQSPAGRSFETHKLSFRFCPTFSIPKGPATSLPPHPPPYTFQSAHQGSACEPAWPLIAPLGKVYAQARPRLSLPPLVVGHDPFVQAARVVRHLLGREPVRDFVHGRLGTVRAVTDVAAHADGQVPPDGPRDGGGGVGGPKEDAAGLDGVLALPNHGHDGAGGEVGNEPL